VRRDQSGSGEVGDGRDGPDRVRPAPAARAAFREVLPGRARSAARGGNCAARPGSGRRPRLMLKQVAVLASVLLLGACSTINEWLEGKVEYKSASTLPPLEIPPDLTSPQRDNR